MDLHLHVMKTQGNLQDNRMLDIDNIQSVRIRRFRRIYQIDDNNTNASIQVLIDNYHVLNL